jgi:hypothetical protein
MESQDQTDTTPLQLQSNQVLYVVQVRGYPEYKIENMVGTSPKNVAEIYVRGYGVPEHLWDALKVYDCYTATMYGFSDG